MEILVISNLFSFVIGIIYSLLSWFILSYLIIPKVEFSSYISKLPCKDEKSSCRYRFKFINNGRRSLIDVYVIARYSINLKGLKDSSIQELVSIPLDYNYQTEFKIPEVPSGKSRLIRLFVSEAAAFTKNTKFPNELKNKAQNKTLNLEDILSVNDTAKLTMYVLGYDRFSGTRKMFKSDPYTKDSIKEGVFNSLSINENFESPSDI